MALVIPNARDEIYWDRDALIAEEKRVFEVCNGCRLCWNLCPSFPALFNAVDALDKDDDEPAQESSGIELDEHGNHDFAAAGHVAKTRKDVRGQVDALDQIPMSVHEDVVDLCYQCKLCDPICPYTPPHEFAIDFPRMMLRHRAINARERGVTFQDRMLGDPDLIGKVGTMIPTIANFGLDVRANRVMMELTVGIHRDRQLPSFASETFQEWFGKRNPNPPEPSTVDGPKVVLFHTCTVQWNEPQVGRAAVEVLEHNGFTVFSPQFQCCGMPALDGGDVPRVNRQAQHNIDILLPYIAAGCDVVTPGPSCTLMLKDHWYEYLGTDEAQTVATHTYDLMEFLWKLRKAKRLKREFPVEMGSVGYHVPCHLKVQKIGFRGRDLMKRMPGTTVKMVDKCSCMDGTWGMKKEYYDLSKKGAEPLLSGLVDDAPDLLSSDCLIAKLQIEEGTNQKVLHPIEIVWRGYGGTDETPLQPSPPIVPEEST
jgi:glycerol-3-phosphate dehydrogenase subunit C